MRRILLSIIAAACALAASAIDKILLADHSETALIADEIIHLPGLGLGLKCGPDSVILFDNPELAAVRWLEPTGVRSIAACGGQFYAAEGDSIYRIATAAAPRKFIGRMDNEQFSLYPATDSTFFACTADEDFSCVYEINPLRQTCMPYISVQAALLKLSAHGGNTMIWIDDQILLAMADEKLVPVFSSESICDMVMTPVGLMAATADGLYWITEPGKGACLVNEPISRVWWDDADVLYYLTASGNLFAVVGMEEAYSTRVK